MSEPQTMAPQMDPVEMAELLRRKLAGYPFPYSFIREVDPYSATPDDLVYGVPGTDRGEGKGVAWYFCWRAEWHGSAGGGSSSKRRRKVAAAGETSYYWHPEEGKQAIIAGMDGKPVGAYKRTLSYIQKIKNPPGMATPFRKKRLGWKMLEVGLDDPDQGLVLCKLYRTNPAQTHPETSTVPNVPCPAPAPAPAPLGAEFPMSMVAIVRNGSATAAAVTHVIDLCGSSIPPPDRIKDMANLVRSLEHPVVVLSAIWSTTSTILSAAWKALRCGPEKVCHLHELVFIKDLHLRTIHELGLLETSTVSGSLDELEYQIQQVAMTKELTRSTRDYLISFGESTSTKIFYEYLNKLEGTEQEWKLRRISTSESGSSDCDLTAAPTSIYGALNTTEIQVWKDVDGIFTCDPKVCAGATLIPHLNFDEAAELSDFGEQSMKRAMEYGISVRVGNPYKPHVPGTVITKRRDMSESTLTSIILKSNITMLDLKSKRMLGQSDFFITAMSKFQHFEYLGISVHYVSASGGNMSFTLVPSELLSQELIKLELDNVVEELQIIAEVHQLDDRSVISLIGNAQKFSSIEEKVHSVLRSINAEVYRFSHDSSKVMKASLVVEGSRAEDCVRALHSAFFEKCPVSQVGGVDNRSSVIVDSSPASGYGINRNTEAPPSEGHGLIENTSVEKYVQDTLVLPTDYDNSWDPFPEEVGGGELGITLESLDTLVLPIDRDNSWNQFSKEVGGGDNSWNQFSEEVVGGEPGMEDLEGMFSFNDEEKCGEVWNPNDPSLWTQPNACERIPPIRSPIHSCYGKQKEGLQKLFAAIRSLAAGCWRTSSKRDGSLKTEH